MIATPQSKNIIDRLAYTKTVDGVELRADWLLKLRIAIMSIHFRAIRAELAPENVIIFAG